MAILACPQTRALSQFSVRPKNILAALVRARPQIPTHLQGSAGFFGLPIRFRHHRNTMVHFEHVAYARHSPGCRVIKRFQTSAEGGRPLKRSHQHPWNAHIHTELGPPCDLIEGVHTACRLADELEFRGRFEPDTPRQRLARSLSCQIPIANGLARRLVDDPTPFGPALQGRNRPA